MKYKILKKLLEQGFTKAELRNGNIRNASLYGEDLSNINLENVNLDESNLKHTDLENTNLRNAVLVNVDLDGANLKNANLENVSLMGAHLNNANLQNASFLCADIRHSVDTKNIIQMSTEFYHVIIFSEFISIGCECKKIADWENMSDKEICSMDATALRFSKKYKKIIFEMIKSRG